MISEKKDFEIDPYILEIPREIIDKIFTDYEDFYSFTRKLLSSKNIPHMMYAIYLIRSQSIKDKYVHAQYIFENDILSLLEEILKQNLENQKIVVSMNYYIVYNKITLRYNYYIRFLLLFSMKHYGVSRI